MRRFRRRAWPVWAALAAAVAIAAAALAFISVELIRLERGEAIARRDAMHAEAVRVALWRMDSRLAPMLATEAARPPFHLLPEYAAAAPFAHLVAPSTDAAAQTPSPLRTLDDPLIQLHVHVYPDANGVRRAVSPQAPGGADDLVHPVAAERLRGAAAALSATPLESRIAHIVSCQDAFVASAESGTSSPRASIGADAPAASDVAGGQIDFARRISSSNRVQTSRGAVQTWRGSHPAEGDLVEESVGDLAIDPVLERIVEHRIEVGPFVPLWIESPASVPPAPPALFYLRTVTILEGSEAGAIATQGFAVDWPRLREALLDDVAELVPGATLEPMLDSTLEINLPAMAAVPVRLIAPPPPLAAAVAAPARTMIAVAWAGLALAVGAAAVTLWVVRADANRRTQFAGTVTHELRTPLTTLRLYADLLADDMAPPERRSELLRTLSAEAERLSDTVEHVLAAARIEAGRTALRLEPISVGDLATRLDALLARRRTPQGALAVERDGDESRICHVDCAAVERIVTNLLDNAQRYAGGAPVTLHCREDRVGARIEVVDRGPGIAPEMRRRLFCAFERGHDDTAQSHRGIGLGLALSRDLARAMGGDLTHEPTPDGGATFRLTLR